MTQNQQSDALKEAAQKFTRQIFIFAIIESTGFTVIIFLYITQMIPEDLFTMLLIGWLVLVGIPLVLTIIKYQQKRTQLLGNQTGETSRPNLISKG